jgi:cell division septation protein DedD
MALWPNPRTSPTLPSHGSHHTEQEEPRWQIRLSPISALMVLGVVTGSLVCSFYLGLISGQRAGFESAQAINLQHAVKLPIPEEYRVADDEADLGSEVYAKLTDPAEARGSLNIEAAKELPEIGSIPTLEKNSVRVDDKNFVKNSKEGVRAQAKGELAESVSKLLEVSANKPSAGGNPDGTLRANPGENRALKIAEVKSAPVQNSAAQNATIKEIAKSGPTIGSLNSQTIEAAKTSNSVSKKPNANLPISSDTAARGNKAPEIIAGPSDDHAVDRAVALASKAKESSLIRSVLPAGWFAQVAAPRQLKDAEELSRKLKSSGFKIMIEQANVRGEEYFRVLVGPEDSRSHAQELLGQLGRESYLRGEPFLRLVR